MLLGNFIGAIGEGRRVAFPKRYREALGQKLILTRGLDRNLVVVSDANWKVLLHGIENHPFAAKKARELQAFLFGNATLLDFDEQGRFVLPEYLMKHAEMTKEVVFVGMNTFVQIWDREKWEEYQERIKEGIGINIENLSRE